MFHGLRLINHASARRNHGLLYIEIQIRLLLDTQETVIALFCDDLLQKLSGLLLDHKIHIHEGISKTLRKKHADGALSGRRHSDHQNIFFLHNLCLALLSVSVNLTQPTSVSSSLFAESLYSDLSPYSGCPAG